jgi:hypothetical protein
MNSAAGTELKRATRYSGYHRDHVVPTFLFWYGFCFPALVAPFHPCEGKVASSGWYGCYCCGRRRRPYPKKRVVRQVLSAIDTSRSSMTTHPSFSKRVFRPATCVVYRQVLEERAAPEERIGVVDRKGRSSSTGIILEMASNRSRNGGCCRP